MKRLYKNENGYMVLIGVVISSAAVLTLLTSFYIYQINRIKHQARIKEAYKIFGVMEDAAKIIKSAYDKKSAELILANQPVTPTDVLASLSPGGVLSPTVRSFPGGDVGCKATCIAKYGGNDELITCFDNFDIPASPYCFYRTTSKVSEQQAKAKTSNSLNYFMSKLDQTFDSDNSTNKIPRSKISTSPTLFGWILGSEMAHAGSGPDITNQLATIPLVDGGNSGRNYCLGNNRSGCVSCGMQVPAPPGPPGATSVCINLELCPFIFPACANYQFDGSGVASPLFRQKIYIQSEIGGQGSGI